MDYPKSTPGIGLVDGLFVDENPVTGQPGSLIPSAWANGLMAELLGVIRAAGIVPSEENTTQLLSAIQTIAASDFKKSVRCATTGPVALSGLQTIDGVILGVGDRVLVKDQASAAQNWIYVAGADAWVRAQDANESAECTPGHLIVVQTGTQAAGTIWQLMNTEPPALGTTALNFRLVFGKSGVQPGGYRKVEVDAQGRVVSGSNPTTLGGYYITDAYTKTQGDERYALKGASLADYGILDAYKKTETLSKQEILALFPVAGQRGATGYDKLSTGLIIQWGKFSAGVSSYTFPLAFPNACAGISQMQSGSSSAQVGRIALSSEPTLTGFQTSGSVSSTTPAYWIAIGF